MSRINEGLRRAAEEASEDATAADMAKPDPVLNAEMGVMAREPFPVEIAEVLRTGPQPRTTSATPSASNAAKTEGASALKVPRLFERIDARLAEKVVADEKMAPASREQYRRLAAVLHDAQANRGFRVLMIASAMPGEGKTLTAANLALTLSESYQNQVLLIDADLRKPTLHQVFGLDAAVGLNEGLEAEAHAKLVLRQVSPRLSILPAGRPTADPMAALTSTRMRQLVGEAKEAFDWVILDTPPLMLLPDAHLLSSLVDAAVLVVRANATPHDLVKRSAEIIGRDRIVGVLLNQASADAQPGYGQYHSYGYQLANTPGAGHS